MLELTMQSKEVSEGYSISSHMTGEATTKELKAVIKAMLYSFVESTSEEIVICALEEYAKERLGLKDE